MADFLYKYLLEMNLSKWQVNSGIKGQLEDVKRTYDLM